MATRPACAGIRLRVKPLKVWTKPPEFRRVPRDSRAARTESQRLLTGRRARPQPWALTSGSDSGDAGETAATGEAGRRFSVAVRARA